MATDEGQTNKFAIHAACRDGQSKYLFITEIQARATTDANEIVNLAESLLNVRRSCFAFVHSFWS
jgi:hypothetical protein